MMMAITVDGKIAKKTEELVNWTSPEDKKLFVKISKERKVVIMGNTSFKTLRKPLKDRLNVVFSHNENKDEDNLKWVKGKPSKVLEELEKLGYSSALLIGGSTINTLFLKEKLITDIILTIEAKIFGTGLSLFNQEMDANLELLEFKKLNSNTLMLHYKIQYV